MESSDSCSKASCSSCLRALRGESSGPTTGKFCYTGGMKVPGSGGGWQAIAYTLRTARKVGIWNLWRAMRTKNTCKTCALGMGGQQGGMRNEKGHFPEFCKKSLQAMAADMQGRIEERFFEQYSIAQMEGFSPREMEMMGR